MNNYCLSCKNSCEEVIPTFNCKFQNMDKNEVLSDWMRLNIQLQEQNQKVIELLKQEPELNNKDMTFQDKQVVYDKEFSLGFLGDKIDNKLILISLICSFVLMARKKDSSLTVLDCVKKLTDYEQLASVDKFGIDGKFYESLAVICESFLYGVTEGNTFGIKNAKDLKDKVKEILSNRVPF